MSDGQVKIKVGMDASGVQQGARQVDSSLSGIEKLAGGGLGFGVLAGIGQAAFNTITKAVSEAFNAIVQVGSEYEAQMSKVEAISGASASEMAMISDKAREMGATTVFSAKEAGQAMEYMAMAGWKASDMVEGIGGIMDLAAASGEDLAKTSDILTDGLTAFGMSAKESGRFADVLAAASSNANTNVSLMGDTFKYVGAVAGAMGYSVEDIAIATGLMANAGIKGTQAGTALRSTITRLAKPTKESREAMDELGISLTDEEGKMLSFREILYQMRGGFASLDEAQKASYAAMLGGKEAMSGLLSIVNASDEDFEKLADAIDGSAGAAKNMADVASDNLAGSLKEFESAASELGLTLYDAFSGILTGIVDFGTMLVGGLASALKTEKTDLTDFLDLTRSHAEEATKAIQESYAALDAGEAEVGKLSAYEKVMLQVVDAGKANEYQTYMIEKAISELGDTMPEIVEAWDAETRTLRLNRKEVEKNFETRKRMARMDAIAEAQVQAQKALGEAELSRAMAEDAIWTAVNKANEAYANQRDEISKLGEDSAEYAEKVYQQQVIGTDNLDEAVAKLLNDVSGLIDQSLKDDLQDAYDSFNGTSEQCEQYAKEVEKLDRMEASLTESMKGTAGETERLAEATQEETRAAAEAAAAQEAAAERVAAAQARLTDAYKKAKEIVVDAFDSAKKAAKSTFSINPFEAWDIDAQQSAAGMKESLDNQVKDMQAYKANMETIMSKIGAVEGGAEFIQYLQNLGPAGARAVSELASGAVDLEATVQSYAEALNVQDELTSAMALDALALQEGLGLLSSTVEEWAGLESVVDDMKEAGTGISDAAAQAFASAAETARAVGAQIPEGLAEAILTSEDPEAAINEATDAIIAATKAKGEGMLEVAKKAGVAVPASIKDGLEEGGPAAVEAYKQLMALFNAPEVKAKAEEAAENTGKDAGKAAAKGAKDEAGGMTTAAETNVNAFTTQVRSKTSEATSAGAEIGKAGAGGAISTTALWADAGANVARGFAEGIRNGRSLVINAAVSVAQAGIAAAEHTLDEHSPSRVFRRIGFMASKGWALGMTDAGGMVVNASNLIAEASTDAAATATASIERAFAKMEKSLKAGAARGDFTGTYKKALETATDAVESAISGAKNSLKKVSDRYFTAISDANAERIEALEARQESLQEARNAAKVTEKSPEEISIEKEIEALRKKKTKIDKLKSEFASSVLSAYGAALEGRASRLLSTLEANLDKVTSKAQEKMDAAKSKISSMRSNLLNVGDTWNGTMTGRTLIDNVRGQITAMRDYEDMLKQLESRGISKTLLKEIEGMDVAQASEYMTALLSMTDKDLSSYDKLFKKRAKEAKRIANEHYADEVEAIKTGYVDEIESLFARVEKSVAKMGEQTMKGFISGMKESDYSREIRNMAKSIIKSMADELQIHSPSRAAWDLGTMFSLGFTRAIEAGTAQVEKAMTSYADAGTEAMKKELAASIRPPELGSLAKARAAGVSGSVSTVPDGAANEAEYHVTLITTLDGREIARGTAVYTQAELSRLQTIQARKEGYV